jgi:hypothetical protein
MSLAIHTRDLHRTGTKPRVVSPPKTSAAAQSRVMPEAEEPALGIAMVWSVFYAIAFVAVAVGHFL